MGCQFTKALILSSLLCYIQSFEMMWSGSWWLSQDHENEPLCFAFIWEWGRGDAMTDSCACVHVEVVIIMTEEAWHPLWLVIIIMAATGNFIMIGHHYYDCGTGDFIMIGCHYYDWETGTSIVNSSKSTIPKPSTEIMGHDLIFKLIIIELPVNCNTCY